MSLTSLQVITAVLPDPDTISSDRPNSNYERINSTLSFNYYEPLTVRTLSPDKSSSNYDSVGLLYVPDLDANDPCINASAPSVPANVTRQANLPDTNPNLVAIAPWLSPQCTKNYLASARQDPQVQALIFFLADGGTGVPPPANDPSWDLGDGGTWKRSIDFPVYAIPGASASMLLKFSALYSGNMTSVPFGSSLTEAYDSRDYVRLYVDVESTSTNALPSLWEFLLMIIGILFGVVAIISIGMRMLQRRRRRDLQRRIASGDVNLEALGVKRMTVPQSILDKMPLYKYDKDPPVAQEDHGLQKSEDVSIPSSPTLSKHEAETTTTKLAGIPVDLSGKFPCKHAHDFDQPTCAICLDDFVKDESLVRQLPCGHIFHSDCVDTFLRDNSSLCPLCKKSALPKGYCPTAITNAMVRRERLMRRMRPRVDGQGGYIYDEPVATTTFSERIRRNFRGQSIFHHTDDRRTDVELGQRAASAAVPISTPLPEALASSQAVTGTLEPGPPPVQRTARREWARQRALAMVGPRATPTEIDGPQNLPRWRKWVHGLFPT